MNIYQSHINVKYRNSSQELIYLEVCIDFIKNNIENEFDTIHQEYEEAKGEKVSHSEQADGITEEIKLGLIDESYRVEKFHFENVSKTIVESLFIRQVAIVEKFLVDLSFEIYDAKKQGDILPPNSNLVERDRFSDCLKSVDAIKNYLDINLKELDGWSTFAKMRKIRHKLAHANNTFILKKDDAQNSYNNIFSNEVVVLFEDIFIYSGDENYEFLKNKRSIDSNEASLTATITHPEKGYYQLNSNYELLIEINRCFSRFIDAVKDIVLINYK